MRLTTEECSKAEVLIKRDCGNYDNKHINKLSDKEVHVELLDGIEKGCPIEAVTAIKGGVEVRKNAAKGCIEIRFSVKPDAAVLANLRANGWRWTHRNGGCWYHGATDANRAYAKEIAKKSECPIECLTQCII